MFLAYSYLRSYIQTQVPNYSDLALNHFTFVIASCRFLFIGHEEGRKTFNKYYHTFP